MEFCKNVYKFEGEQNFTYTIIENGLAYIINLAIWGGRQDHFYYLPFEQMLATFRFLE